jgi:cell division septation protein DedD
VAKLQIIPCLPDPNGKEIYRLQVASFLNPDAASELENQLKAAGFNAAIEYYSNLHRVLVTDVPSALVQYTAQRLEALGIKQIWIR